MRSFKDCVLQQTREWPLCVSMTRIKRKVQYIFISLFSSPSLDVDHVDDKARMDHKLYYRWKILFSVYSSSPADPKVLVSDTKFLTREVACAP